MNELIDTEIRAYRTPEWGHKSVSLFITTIDYAIEEGETAKVISTPTGFTRAPRAVRFQTEDVVPGAQHPCAIRFTDTEAQILMDSLWEAGIRPAAAAGSVGQLGAVERHLSDMRAIAFGQLQIAPK